LVSLFEARYQRLREIALRKLGHGEAGNSVGPTDLVHEALLRMARASSRREYADEDHFLCTVARVMGHILIDRARRRAVRNRVLGRRLPDLPESLPDQVAPRLLADMADALESLDQADPDLAEVFRLRFFLELSFDDIAAVLNTPRTTVFRHWTLARAKVGSMLNGDASSRDRL